MLLDREYIIEELKKCKKDIVYFVKTYCKIQHPIRGRVMFELYNFQEETLQQLLTHDRNIILKSRQMGISTLVAAYALWYALFFKDKKILVIATKVDVAKNIIHKCQIMYDELPQWFRNIFPTVEENKLSISFKNGSNIKAESSSTSSGRSEAVSLLIIDECAFIRGIEELWASAQQTTATGGKILVLSTPNGVGNLFHKIWVGAIENTNGFHAIKLPWYLHPERDQQWRDKQTKELGEKLARQECDCDFISSGTTLIEGTKLESIRANHVIEPIEKLGVTKDLWIFKQPQQGVGYLLCADVARGDGSDYSAFHIIDIENNEQCAEYKGKIETFDYAHLIVETAKMYNNAIVIVENANIGWSVLQKIVEDIRYENVYYSPKNEDSSYATELQYYFPHYYNVVIDNSRWIAGFTTSMKTRNKLIILLEQTINNNDCIIHSNRLLNELYTFIWQNGKAQAMKGYNDDLVMSFAVGLYVKEIVYRFHHKEIKNLESSLNNIIVYKENKNNNIISKSTETAEDNNEINDMIITQQKKTNISNNNNIDDELNSFMTILLR